MAQFLKGSRPSKMNEDIVYIVKIINSNDNINNNKNKNHTTYIYILTIRGMVNPVQLKDQLYVIRTLESALRSYFGRPGTSVPLGSIKTP